MPEEKSQVEKEKKSLEKQVNKLEKEKLKLDLKLAKEKAKSSANTFKKESKKAILTAITAAFGFLLALVWRELITVYVNEATALSPVQSQWIEVTIVTIISVIGIIVVTMILKDEE